MSGREVAKFFSGFAANQVLTHAALAASGSRFTVLGIAYTRGLNMAAAAFWAIIVRLLVCYAWIKQ